MTKNGNETDTKCHQLKIEKKTNNKQKTYIDTLCVDSLRRFYIFFSLFVVGAVCEKVNFNLGNRSLFHQNNKMTIELHTSEYVYLPVWAKREQNNTIHSSKLVYKNEITHLYMFLDQSLKNKYSNERKKNNKKT